MNYVLQQKFLKNNREAVMQNQNYSQIIILLKIIFQIVI